jgi:hypothetical protein
MPRAEVELAVNDVFHEIVGEPASVKLLCVAALVAGGLLFGVAFGMEALVPLAVAYFFLLGWAYGGDALR